MARATTEGMSPFFIVSDVSSTVEFYGEQLGFSVTFQNDPDEPFFAILARDRARLFVKADRAAPPPTPNSTRHPAMRWDAYVFVPDPDTLADEFGGNGVTFSRRLEDTADGLRGFELVDPDGYVLFFGRPR